MEGVEEPTLDEMQALMTLNNFFVKEEVPGFYIFGPKDTQARGWSGYWQRFKSKEAAVRSWYKDWINNAYYSD